MRQIAVVILILTGTVLNSIADGKMFWTEKIPPEIPYQRALILFDEGTETLILQSRYVIPEDTENSAIGWVVPVPSVPEVASIPADTARKLFFILSMNSRPRVTSIIDTILGYVLLAVLIIPPLILLLCLLSFIFPFPKWFLVKRGKIARYSLWSFLTLFILLAICIPRFVSLGGLKGVDVISEQRVGIYDVKVIKSDKAGALIDWLNEHKFSFEEKDTAVFESYISQGWCFVVAIINPSEDDNEQQIVSEGLAAPLILRFPHPNPIYPVALTGTGGFETEILIYLASSTKMTCNDRLTLRYAGMKEYNFFDIYFTDTDPEDFFDQKTTNIRYLCKFRDKMSPEQMDEDIIFEEAKDDQPYREHIIEW